MGIQKRSAGVVFLSLFFIFMNVLALARSVGAIPSGAEVLYLFVNNALVMLGNIVSFIGSLALIVLGIFLFMLREKARKWFLITQWLSLVGGTAMAFRMAAWTVGGPSLGWATAVVFGSILFNLYPIIFIIFFTRPKVKEQFQCTTT